MSFISIHQYFNKLQIVFLSLMIVPLLAFIAIHLWPDLPKVGRGVEWFVVIPSIALLDWMLAIITFDKKIKSARNQQGLGAKLEKYFNITIVRYSLVAGAGLTLAVGYLLTLSQIFAVMYLVSLLTSVFFWPTGPRVARELMLRGDEREMVYFRKDTF